MSIMVFLYMCWFWFMSWIAAFWPTCCSISNGFSYIILATLTFTIVYFACWVVYFVYFACFSIETSLHKERLESFKTKNKKIANLMKNQKDDTFTNYSVPIINLSSYTLNDSEYNQLKFGLNHCFINKDKHIKKTVPLIWSH